jgi:putative ABC transport system ATP-binding protein
VLVVTHNTAIGEIADRVIRMGSGRVVADERVTAPIAAADVRW